MEHMGRKDDMKRKYETIIFDMDGTVLDTLEDLTDAVNYAMRKTELPEHSIDEVREFVGNGVYRLMERSVPNGEKNSCFAAAFAAFKEYYGSHCNDKTRAYDGILPLLRQLKRDGYALAIVSNKLDSAVKELAELYFEGIVPVAIGETEGVAKKPAADMVYRALGELGMPKETALYVGDSEVDVMTAKNAGLPCISVLWGFRSEAFLRNCGGELFVKTPAEIRVFLESCEEK